MKKYRLTQCVLAALLGLTVAFLACACASEDANESQEQSALEPNNDTSVLERSEINTEGSTSEAESVGIETESIVTSDETSAESEYSDESEYSEETVSTAPIEPVEPTYPEERETTLELIKEYPLGEGGIPFALHSGEDPTYIRPSTSDWLFADEKGNLYAYNGQRFYNFQTAETFRPSVSQPIMVELIADGKWYCLTMDGRLVIYTEQGDQIASVKCPIKSKYPKLDLFVASDGVPRVVIDGVFYDIDGNEISALYSVRENGADGYLLTLSGKEYVYNKNPYIACYANGILTAWESKTHRDMQCPNGLDHVHVSTYIDKSIYQYDKDGNPLSEFSISIYGDNHPIACEIVYDGMVCKEYAPISVTVADQRFDNLIDADWFVGADGTIYLMLIDLDGGKLYKINPGYSDVTFEDFETDAEIQ